MGYQSPSFLPWPSTFSPSTGGAVQFQPKLLWPASASGHLGALDIWAACFLSYNSCWVPCNWHHGGGDFEVEVRGLSGLDCPLGQLTQLPKICVWAVPCRLSSPISFNFHSNPRKYILYRQGNKLRMCKFLKVTCFCLSHSKPHVFILYFLCSALIGNRNLKNHTIKLLHLCK